MVEVCNGLWSVSNLFCMFLFSLGRILKCLVCQLLQAQCVLVKLLATPSLHSAEELEWSFCPFLQAWHEACAVHQFYQPKSSNCYWIWCGVFLQLFQKPGHDTRQWLGSYHTRRKKEYFVVVKLNDFVGTSIHDWVCGGTLSPLIDVHAMAWPLRASINMCMCQLLKTPNTHLVVTLGRLCTYHNSWQGYLHLSPSL